MNEDAGGFRNRRNENRAWGGNNRGNPPGNVIDPPILFSHLGDAQKQSLLRETGYLYGFFVDGHDGPRRSTRQVARRKDNAQYPSNSIQEQNNTMSEDVSTKTDRDANFAHQGWSLSALSTTTPWIASRIEQNIQAPGDNSWTTRSFVLRRLVFTLALQDLLPVPEFEADVRAALGKPNKLGKFLALNEVFQLWGDVIPLSFDLGISVAITDLAAKLAESSASNTSIRLHDLTASRTARINTQGGEANLLPSGDANVWLARAVPPYQWAQVRVVKVVPIVDLLQPETKSQIMGLYSTQMSYHPPHLDGVIDAGQFFDGSTYALKTISSLVIRSNSYVVALSVVYLDGTRSPRYGGTGGNENVFKLNNGEHITEVMVWADADWVYALQFITSNGRISSLYGGEGGTPKVLSSEDGVLAGFSGNIKSNTMNQLQTIWRHSVIKTRPSQSKRFFKYFGGTGGSPFTDWHFLKSSNTAYISSINIRSGTYIDGIQVVYDDNRIGETVGVTGPWHGGPGGKQEQFKLEAGEHIIRVQGKHNNYIVQLRFVTNKGRTSGVYGGGEGTEFHCEPPRRRDGNPMRLSYIAGKSGKWVNGILFVWAPLSHGL